MTTDDNSLALAEISSQLRMLAAFDLVFLFVCTALFGAVLEE